MVLIGYACCNKPQDDTTNHPSENDADSYVNPVVNQSLPDPTVIQAEDGTFYLYATEDIRNTPIYKSTDLVHWTFASTAFTDQTRPRFEPNGGVWAPDINFINGKYVLYYSMSVWGGEWTCGIGVATADHPEGPFTDHGKLFISSDIGVQNSIDPFFIEDQNKNYLFWGSFRGIYAIELSADGLSIQPNTEKIQVAGTAYEGTYILKRDQNYYLFASIGSCCNGVESTYTTVVAKSSNIFGPYESKTGGKMLQNNHEIVISATDRFVGTGHNAEIVTDDADNDWILYHAVDKLNPKGRVLMLSQLMWHDGWPVVKEASMSGTAPMPSPIFNH